MKTSVRRVGGTAVAVATAIMVISSTAFAGGRTFTTTLTPEQETGGGHAGGSGTAKITLNQGQGTVCFDVSWANINAPTGAHIHEAPAGDDGDIVVPLFGAQASGTGSTSGCIEDVSTELIKDIRQNPEGYYVNVHDTDHTAGAIRGQLAK